MPTTRERLTYKAVCITMYVRDLERLDGYVDMLRNQGFPRPSRSMLVRAMVRTLDVKALVHALRSGGAS